MTRRLGHDHRATAAAAWCLAALIIGMLALPAVAQQPCGSSVNPRHVPHILTRQANGVYDLQPHQRGGTLHVPVTFHIVRPDNGVGGLTPTRLDDIIDYLNQTYGPAGMEFCQPGPTNYIDNSSAYLNIDSQAEIYALYQIGDVPDTVNIYFVASVSDDDGGLCGQATFTDNDNEGVIVDFDCSNLEALVAHEVGHYFDVYHTHETAFGVECPSGDNCGTAGDLVCDTPADFDLSGCLDSSCTLQPPCQDQFLVCGDFQVYFYNPLLDNIMSYARASCQTTMTSDQIDRARATLINLRPELLGGCNQGNICGESGAGNCFNVHSGEGCDDHDCCQVVCEIDPTCCILGWDQGCVDLAAQWCGSCGNSLSGSCVDPNTASPGCTDAACCTTVCALDPFCCETAWDDICVNLAIDNCLVAGDEPQNCITAVDGENDGYLGDNTDWSGNDTPQCAGFDLVDEWYCYTATCTGVVTATTCGATLFDSALAVFESDGTIVDCNDNDIGPVTSECDPQNTGINTASTVKFNVTQGEQYLIRVSLADTLIGYSFDLTIDCQPPQCGDPGTGSCFTSHPTTACSDTTCCQTVCAIDPFCCDTQWDSQCVAEAQIYCNADPGEECLAAEPITDGAHDVSTADNDGAVPADSSCGGGSDTVDQWYAYTAPYDAAVTAKICALFNIPKGYVPQYTLAVYEDCAGTELACGNDNPVCTFPSNSAQIIWSAEEGKTYYIRLSSPPDAVGAGTLEINAGGCGLDISGDCFVNNGNRGCDDADCCTSVCQIDPFCCTIFWDDECALIAQAICGCPADLAEGDNLVNVFDLLELLAGWAGDGAGADLAEPDNIVNVFDLLELLSQWGPCD